MRDLYLTLRMNLDPAAAEGPGWYIVASGDTELIPYTRVAPAAAEIIAKAFQEVVLNVTTAHVTPLQMVASGNNLIRQAVEEELRFAEAQAQRIKGLRTHLQALQGSSASVEEQPEKQE